MKRFAAAVAGAALVAVTLTGCVLPHVPRVSSSTSSDDKPADKPTPAPEPGSSIDDPAPAGTTITLTSSLGNYSLTFAAPVFNATAQIHAQNQFNDLPAAGMQYLMDSVTVANTGTDALDFNPLVQLNGVTFATTDGHTYQQKSFLVVPSPISDVQSIAPGTSASGNVVWTVPAGTADGVWVVTAGSDSEFVAAK